MTGTAVATVGRDDTAPETYQLIALDRPQLEAAHAKMITFVRERRAAIFRDMDEERAALEVALKNKWAVKRHHSVLDRLGRRVTFFDKIEAALVAGYVIVPNFELQLFAIRTKAKTPRGSVITSTYDRNDQFFQVAQLLPAGEGRYVAPVPIREKTHDRIPDGKGGEKDSFKIWPTDFDDVDFPVVMAKPALMTSAGLAMAKKVFDEMGVAVDSRFSGRRRGDPILVGRIRNPTSGRADVSFYLGWYFDPTSL